MQPAAAAAMNRFKEALIQFAHSSPNLFPQNHTTDYPTLINQQFSEFFTDFHTPNHPPYAAMINRAIQELNETGGSSEESISKYIEEEYVDLPWAHSALLKHHLEKLCDLKEICQTHKKCYLLVGADSDPVSATTPEKQQKTSETGKKSRQSGKKQKTRQDLKLGKTSSWKGKKGKKQKSRLDSESAKISSKHHEKNKKKGKFEQITEVCQKEDQAIQVLDEVADQQEKHDVCIDQEMEEGGVCANATEQNQTEKILLIKHSDVTGSEDQPVELSNDTEQIGTKKRKNKKQKIMPKRSSKRSKKNEETQLLVLSEANLKLEKEITDAASQEQKQMIEVKTSDTQIQEENKDVEVCQKEDQAIEALDEVADEQEKHDVCIDQELGEGEVCANITEQNQTEKILLIKHSDVTGSEDQSVELSNDKEQIGTCRTKKMKNKKQKILPTRSSKRSKKNETRLLVSSEANLNLDKEITDAASQEQKQMIEVKTSDTQIQEENKDVEVCQKDRAIEALDEVADEQEKHDVCIDQELGEGGVCANTTEKILLIKHSEVTGSEDQSVELSNDKEQIGTCGTKKRKNKKQKMMPTRSSKRSKKNEETQLLVLSEANLNLDIEITDAASQEQKQMIEVKISDTQIQEENKDVEMALELHSDNSGCKYMSDQISIGVQTSDTQIQEKSKDVEMALELHSDNSGHVNLEQIQMEQSPPILKLEESSISNHMLQREGKFFWTRSLLKSVLKRDVVAGSELTGSPGNANMPKGKLDIIEHLSEEKQQIPSAVSTIMNNQRAKLRSSKMSTLMESLDTEMEPQQKSRNPSLEKPVVELVEPAQVQEAGNTQQDQQPDELKELKPKPKGRGRPPKKSR